MNGETFLVLILVGFALSVRVRIDRPANPEKFIHSLYSYGITADSEWNLYVPEDRLTVLATLANYTAHPYPAMEARGSQTGYTSYYALMRFCAQMEREYPRLAERFSLGYSVDQRELVGVKIRTQARRKKVKLVGNMHGDETVGREMLIRMIEYLLTEYKHGNPEVHDLLGQCEIHILPSMNPDGFARRQRVNARGFDLNRNFPDRFYGQITPLQPETLAVMRWSQRENFTLSANFHGGDLVANYPYDGNRQRRSGLAAPTRDDAEFRHLASTYAKAHPDMHLSRRFPGGITNGAAWYVLYGGMQDWNYLHTHDREITLEISKIKNPPGRTLEAYWEKNAEAILRFMQEIKRY